MKKTLVLTLTALLFCLTITACTVVKKSDVTYSQGLEFRKYKEGTYYVDRIGSCTDTDIVIPPTYKNEKVTGIGTSAFEPNSPTTTITSVTIPDTVTSIGDRAFMNCTALTTIYLPDSITSIGHAAFFMCDSLTSIRLPDGLTSIESTLFYKCSKLHSVTIPNSVTSIGYDAFYDCNSLTDIYYAGTEEQWNQIQKSSGWDDGTGSYTIHYNYVPEE